VNNILGKNKTVPNTVIKNRIGPLARNVCLMFLSFTNCIVSRCS